MADNDKDVNVVIDEANNIINVVCNIPALPTIHPVLKYIITPHIHNNIELIQSKVPNFCVFGVMMTSFDGDRCPLHDLVVFGEAVQSYATSSDSIVFCRFSFVRILPFSVCLFKLRY